jgi:hypothetical protein
MKGKNVWNLTSAYQMAPSHQALIDNMRMLPYHQIQELGYISSLHRPTFMRISFVHCNGIHNALVWFYTSSLSFLRGAIYFQM